MKKWFWLIYPVMAGMFILYTAVNIVSDPVRWVAMSQQQQDIAAQEAEIAQLREKLAKLDSFDKDQAQKDLQVLLDAVPPSRLAWSLIAELKHAATDAGVQITAYKGQGGEVKEASSAAALVSPDGVLLMVTADVSDIARLRRFVADLYAYYPLVRVNKVLFVEGEAKITVEGAWSAWKKEVSQKGPLPEYAETLAQLKSQMEGYTLQNQMGPGEGESIIPTTNPF